MSLMASFVLSFFPRDVLDEIWDLIESVSGGGGVPTYSCKSYCFWCWLLLQIHIPQLSQQEDSGKKTTVFVRLLKRDCTCANFTAEIDKWQPIVDLNCKDNENIFNTNHVFISYSIFTVYVIKS